VIPQKDWMKTVNDANTSFNEHVERITEELEDTKIAVKTEKDSVQSLRFEVASLKYIVGLLLGKNERLTDKNVGLENRLKTANARYAKSVEAEKKFENLKSKWAGIADILGPNIKAEGSDEADVFEVIEDDLD
jgi:predicted RNase H-like nuclease (RuvC/YqgF family)